MNKDKLITKMHEKFNLKDDDVEKITVSLYSNRDYTISQVDNTIENLLQAEIFVGDTFIPTGYAQSNSNYDRERASLVDAYETFCTINEGIDVDDNIVQILLNRIQAMEI